MQQIDEKKKKKKGLWYNIQKRRAAGKRPHKPGEKGYPDPKTWKRLTSESLLREAIRDTLVDLIHHDEMYSEEDPEFIMRDPKHAEWLKSLADEYEEEFGGEDDGAHRGMGPDEFSETSGGPDRPLSDIR